MRRFTAKLLIVMVIFSLVGPYYAKAEEKENTIEGNKIEIVNENAEKSISQSSNSSTIQSDIEGQPGEETVDSNLDESNVDTGEEIINDDLTIEHSNDSIIEGTSEPEENEQNQVDESNNENSEQSSLELKQESAEKNVDVQKKANINLKKELQIVQSSISKLGHIKSSTAEIYKDLNDTSSFFTAGSSYTNSVYYIKKQAVIGNQTYYLISKKPSSVDGTVGWIKAGDLTTYNHTGVDKVPKTFYIKGTGSAFNKAWGGSKDLIYTNLSNYKNQAFEVKLTEKVGSNIWYRGVLAGKTVWIHSSYLIDSSEISISKLGQIKNQDVKVYKNYKDTSTSFFAGTNYTNLVYYIKKQAVYAGKTYYLISNQPSSINGVVGWVESSDINTHSHAGVDKEFKRFYIKGTGSAYSKVWGGSKDLVYTSLSGYKDQIFNVNLTEKVGNNIWYRGTLAGKTVWMHASYLVAKEESSISRLGQISNSSVKIYRNIENEKSVFLAGQTHINKVFYIKKQARINNNVFYLLSTQPSSVNGVIGWVSSDDITSYSHSGVEKESKTFYIKGTGKAYSKVWGGSKDLVYSSLTSYMNQIFKVNLTEKVGNNIWYRGTLANKTVWIHSSYLAEKVESNTSRLGQIQNSEVKIYKTIGETSSAFAAGTKYMNSVYYIKKQAKIGDQTYYLISTQSSNVNGVVGWVHISDLTSYTHVGVDKETKTFYIKGTGKAYSKIWGGSKDMVYSTLSGYKNNKFTVNLTEKVGNNTWYRGTLGGKTVWIHEDYLHQGSVILKSYTDYNLTLNNMLEIQMSASPKTDKSYKLWIRQDAFKSGSIANGKGTIDGDGWNLRRGPGTGYLADGQVSNGTVLPLYDNKKGADGYTWYHVKNTTGWVIANPEDVNYHLNPSNFTGTLKNSLQFVRLSESANLNVSEVNQKILSETGILSGKAQIFIDAGQANGVNEVYVIAHALLETGNGTSQLANGVELGFDSRGELVLANDSNREDLTAIKKTYNMFGIGAFDNNALLDGATYAYEKGWFTPEAAIKGGAAFIGDGYVNNGQDTLYKMRWNPLFAASYGYASHQYATDIGWAYKQTSKMYELYQLLDEYTIVLDIPKYK